MTDELGRSLNHGQEGQLTIPLPQLPEGVNIPAPFDNFLVTVPLVLTLLWRLVLHPRMPRGSAVLRKTLDETLNIHSVLGQVLEYTQADRVLLLEFHNGESFTTGRHFMKISATGEVTQGNVSSYLAIVQGSPIVQHAMMINRLTDAAIHRMTVAEVSATEQLDYYAFGIQERVQLMLYYEKEPQGILDIQYCWSTRPRKELDTERVRQMAGQLLFYLRRRNSVAQLFSEVFKLFVPR